MSNVRNERMDIVRGIAVVLMVAGHALIPYASFVYLFHVSLFFIVSGFTYDEHHSESFRAFLEYLIGKIRRLWLPYFIWNAVYTILNNLFIKLNIYTNNPRITEYVVGDHELVHEYMSVSEMIRNITLGFVFRGYTQLGNAFWFLKVLFVISVLYCLLDYTISRIGISNGLMIQVTVSMLFLGVSYYCQIRHVDIPAIPLVCSCYWLYAAGQVIRKKDLDMSKLDIRMELLIMFASLTILVILFQFDSIYLANNYFVNPFFYIVATSSGWCLTYGLADIITRVSLLKRAKTSFNYIGQRSLSVVALQYLAFKPVTWIVTKEHHLPACCIAAFPSLHLPGEAWYLAYLFAGLLIPLGFDALIEMAKT